MGTNGNQTMLEALAHCSEPDFPQGGGVRAPSGRDSQESTCIALILSLVVRLLHRLETTFDIRNRNCCVIIASTLRFMLTPLALVEDRDCSG